MEKIPLTKGKVALVDDEDFEELNKYKWQTVKYRNKFYAQRSSYENGKQKNIKMHRAVLKTPKGLMTDHIDGDGLNNQRSNLRVCTNTENKRNQGKQSSNTSGYKGVSWHIRNKNWQALISVNEKAIYLGSFTTKELAYEAYIEACKKYHGEFARY